MPLYRVLLLFLCVWVQIAFGERTAPESEKRQDPPPKKLGGRAYRARINRWDVHANSEETMSYGFAF